MNGTDTVTRRGRTIVQRLRIASVTIVALVLLTGIGGDALLLRLARFQTTTSERDVPALVHAHDLQGGLSRILGLADRLDRADTVAVVARLEDELASAQGRLRGALDWLRALAVDEAALEPLDRALHGLDEIAGEQFSRRRVRIETKRTLLRHHEALLALRQRVHDQVAPLRIAVDRDIDAALARVGESADGRGIGSAPPLGAATPTLRRVLAERVAAQRRLNEVIVRTDAFVDVAERLLATPAAAGDETFPEHLQRLRFELGSATLALIHLGPEITPPALSAALGELQTTSFGETGIEATLRRRARERALYASGREALIGTIESTSAAADAIVETVRLGVTGSARAFGRRLWRTIALLSAVTLSVIAVVALGGYVVVERQINRRVTRLDRAVRAIAAGDVDVEVGVAGEDEFGDIARALEVFKDNARQLRRSNRELEQFAYAAAHDMKTPLRAIEHLAEWTLEDAGDSLPENCRENLEKLLGRARRLARLQDDLLTYATAGHESAESTPVDLARLCRELHEMLDPGRRFRVDVIGAPASVAAPETPLRQILMNLLANAMRHHDRECGAIEITVHALRGRLHVSVSDDGPGIERRYHERVFGLFEKLRSRDAVEGSGLGLSLVVKLVECHGGTIRLHSDPPRARGTTFSFDLALAA